MKVVLVSFSTLPTMQKYLYFAADELIEQGHDVWTVGSSMLRLSRSTGGRNIMVDTPVSPRPSIRSLRASRATLNSVLQLLETVNPDVIHFVNKHVWNYLLLLRARRRGIDARWVHTFHDPIGHHGDAVQHGVIAYHKLVQRRLDAVIVHSKVAQAQALEVLHPRCRVTRIPLGVTAWKAYQPVEPTGTKRVLVFGRLNRYKGCEMYPAIFDAIRRLDPDVEIVVAGLPSKDLPDGLIDEISSCPNVRYHGHFIEEDSVDDFFREASFVLTPYTSMTQSGVILDAYSNSRAVLAFDINGMSEFVPGDMDLVPAFNIDRYAQRVVDLVNDPRACARAGRHAWGFGLDRFTPASMAVGMAQTYRGLIAVEVGDA